jgi:hypothetical protein
MTDFRTQTQLNRGMRNNNPGNIVIGDTWLGMAGNDGTFVIFVDDTWGIRAMATILSNKINNDGLNTITEIITSWAPPTDSQGNVINDTAGYIAEVASDTGFDPDGELTADVPTLSALTRAIINREEGYTQSAMIPDNDIAQGISMMGSGPATLAQAAAVAVSNTGIPPVALIFGAGLLALLAMRD